MILIIDNYDSFTYNLVQYVEELGFDCVVYRNDALSLDDVARLSPKAIIISPGPSDPDSAGITLSLIATFGPKLPLLGVCLGHQAIGQAFGGKVVRAPAPRHGKLSRVSHQEVGVFEGLPSPFRATRYHSLMVERASLPPCLEVTAESDDGVIMGLKHRDLPIFGVQFHPESIATEHGRPLLLNFLARHDKRC
jgi:anthranilate synthase component 2